MFMSSDIQVRGLELPGRGRRFNEPTLDNFDAAVDDIWRQIVNEIDGNEYAFFGHSLGAKIVYALSQRVVAKKMKPPRHVFFSGRGAPGIPDKDDKFYSTMSDAEFREEILTLGGTPREFFESPELLDVFFPILRSDFKLSEAHEPSDDSISPLPWDISVFIGKDEDLTSDQIIGWRNVTAGNCTIHFFKGGHFFINDELRGVVSRINQTVSLSAISEWRVVG